jgi:CheY-like chemotaxis protein
MSDQITVLIVEDDIDYLETVQESLEASGLGVVTANNGQEGWTAVQEQTINVVILDMVMPGKDGLWFLDTVRNSEQYKDLPVIVLTNLAHGEKIARAVVKGISRMLVKEDTDGAEVVRMIKEVLQINTAS